MTEPAEAEQQLRAFQAQIVDRIMHHPLGGIVLLPTGAGKTLIAFEIIARVVMSSRDSSRAALMIVPTAVLVDQQMHYAKRQLGKYFTQIAGVHGKLSLEAHVVNLIQQGKETVLLVVTPERFLNIAHDAKIHPSRFCVVAFDELHHMSKNHPYCRVADYFRRTSPKRVGLTASLCFEKDPQSIPLAASEVIGTLLGPDVWGQRCANVVHTVTDDQLIVAGVSLPPPVEEELSVEFLWVNAVAGFGNHNLPHEFLQELLGRQVGRLHPVMHAAFAELQQTEERLDGLFNDDTQPFLPSRAWAEGVNLCFIDKLAAQALAVCQVNMSPSSLSGEEFPVMGVRIQRKMMGDVVRDLRRVVLLAEVLRMLVGSRQRYLEFAVHFMCNMKVTSHVLDETFKNDIRHMWKNGQNDVCPLLIKRLKEHMEPRGYKCKAVLFVEQRIASCILADMLNASLNEIDPSISVESATCGVTFVDWICAETSPSAFVPKQKGRDVVEHFRYGPTMIICSTPVLEEGIDVGLLSLVIHVDQPQNVVATVQRTGRARAEDAVAFTIVRGSRSIIECMMQALELQKRFVSTGCVQCYRRRERVVIPSATMHNVKAVMQRWPPEFWIPKSNCSVSPIAKLHELGQMGFLSSEVEEDASTGPQRFRYAVNFYIKGENTRIFLCSGEAEMNNKNKTKTEAIRNAFINLRRLMDDNIHPT